MEREEASRIHQSLLSELHETEQVLRETEQRTAALRQLVEGYEALFPDLRPEPQGTEASENEEAVVPQPRHPRGKKAAMQVLRENGRWMSVSDIVANMVARGWDPKSDDAVRTTLGRLHKEKKIEKGQLDGRTLAYRWPAGDFSARDAGNGDGPVAAGPSAEQEGDNDDGDHHRHPAVAGA